MTYILWYSSDKICEVRVRGGGCVGHAYCLEHVHEGKVITFISHNDLNLLLQISYTPYYKEFGKLL
jgi:hypothetical protein